MGRKKKKPDKEQENPPQIMPVLLKLGNGRRKIIEMAGRSKRGKNPSSKVGGVTVKVEEN